MRRLALIAVLPTLWIGDAAAQAPSSVQIQEWVVPWEESRPRDPYVDNQGRVWFVGQRSDYVAYLEPETGEFKRYELEEGTGPHNLIVDARGQVWYAGNRNAHIGRLDPETGAITRIEMPDPAVRDPHTLVFDNAGDIWFTAQGSNFVGKLTTSNGEVRVVRVPTERSRPYGIVVDGQNRPWFNLFGTNKLGTVDPQTMELREFTVSEEDSRGRRIGLTADGAVWYADYARGSLGRFDPATGEVREWQTPSGSDSRPYAMAIDDRERIWLVETGVRPNRMVGFDTARGEFFSNTAIESGGGAVRHMIFHAPTRAIWFGTDTNTIGRAAIPE